MRTRVLIVTAAALILPGSASAEPAKLPQTRPAARAAPVVLASADQLAGQPQLPAQTAASPVKRPRAARATTCRCGGVPQSETQEQP
jgi:hypothetical protein